MSLLDRERPTLNDLAGAQVRLSRPGGESYPGQLDGDGHFVPEGPTSPAAKGVYELQFREPGTFGWARHDALPTVEL